MWIGSSLGMSIFDGHKLLSFTKQNGLVGGGICHSVIERPNGDFWFGDFEGSIVKYDGDFLYHYTAENSGFYNNSHEILTFDYKDRLLVSNIFTGCNVLDGTTVYAHKDNPYLGSSMIANPPPWSPSKGGNKKLLAKDRSPSA